MEAVVLAGGLGVRLRHILQNLPKPMAPIAGRPFLEILLSTLARKGFTRIVLSLGYKADYIQSHFGCQYEGMNLVYAIEEKPLGTGGGLRLAMDKVVSNHVYVFNGDSYLDLEIPEVEKQWNEDARPIIVGYYVPDVLRYGCLSYKGKLVNGFNEKKLSGPGIINAGCYVLNRNQLDTFPIGKKFSLEVDFLPEAVNCGKFDIFLTNGKFIDIGVPEDYLRAQKELIF